MRWSAFAAAVAATLAAPLPLRSEWTERYFGIGSAGDHGSACEEARAHAQVNARAACAERHGVGSGGGTFTDCRCTSVPAGLHVCNVKLLVVCGDGRSAWPPPQLASTSPNGQTKSPAAPRGAAGRRRDPRILR
jgi:hypothetical protein